MTSVAVPGLARGGVRAAQSTPPPAPSARDAPASATNPRQGSLPSCSVASAAARASLASPWSLEAIRAAAAFATGGGCATGLLSPTPTRLNQSAGSPRSKVENDDTVLNEAGITRLKQPAAA